MSKTKVTRIVVTSSQQTIASKQVRPDDSIFSSPDDDGRRAGLLLLTFFEVALELQYVVDHIANDLAGVLVNRRELIDDPIYFLLHSHARVHFQRLYRVLGHSRFGSRGSSRD